MEWNVYRYNFNENKIEVFNIFNHESFRKDVESLLKKKIDSKKVFSEELKKILMYYFWSKTEHEVVVKPWIDGLNINRKVNVYEQIMNNWNHFLAYMWFYNRRELACNVTRKRPYIVNDILQVMNYFDKNSEVYIISSIDGKGIHIGKITGFARDSGDGIVLETDIEEESVTE